MYRNALFVVGIIMALSGCDNGGAGGNEADTQTPADLSCSDNNLVDVPSMQDSSVLENDQQVPDQDGGQEVEPPDLLTLDTTEVGDAPDILVPPPVGLVVCDGESLPCDFEDPGPSPWPYDSCSGNPFYLVCPDEACVPPDEILQAFFSAWKKEAPGLLEMTTEEFEEHIFVNQVFEWPYGENDTHRLFRVDFLLVMDWVVVRENHTAKIYTGEPLTEESFREALIGKAYNHKQDLTGSVIALDEVFEKFSACHPDMQGDFCHIYWHKANDSQDLNLHISGLAEVDFQANSCLSIHLDLETGEGECSEDVCYVY